MHYQPNSQGGRSAAPAQSQEPLDPSQVEMDDDDELTDAEKDRQAQRCLWVTNIMLMLAGAGYVAVGLYTGFTGHGGAWPGFVDGGIGAFLFVVCFLGFIGALRINHNMLRLYYTCMILGSMANFVMAGTTLLYIKQGREYLATNWDVIVAKASPEDRASLDLSHEQDVLMRNLIICGAGCVLTLLLSLSVLGSVVRLVSKLSAYSILLQFTSICLLPFGAVLLAAGLFIGDYTGASESPIAAFAVFVVGLFVMMLSLLGCFGVTIESRGLLRVFMMLVFLLALAFLAVGIVGLAQSSTLITQLVNQWGTIRRLLPPTFSGKYDKEQFRLFLTGNLYMLAFGCVCIGILMAIQWYASMVLRFAIKEAAEFEDEEGPFGVPAEYGGSGKSGVAPARGSVNSVKIMWKRNWTHGSKKTRMAMKCGCCVVVLAFVAALTLASLALYYTIACDTLSGFHDSRAYADVGLNVMTFNNYTRGSTSVSVHASATVDVTLKKAAFKSGQASPDWPELVNATLSSPAFLSFNPKAKTEIVSFDISCQVGSLDVAVPDASFFGGNDYAASLLSPYLQSITDSPRASVDYDLSAVAAALRPRFKMITATTSSGHIDLTSVNFGQYGAVLQSGSGDITLTSVDGSCDPDSVGDSSGGVRLKTNLGGISVRGSHFKNCDLVAMGSAALIAVSDSESVSNGGGSLLQIESDKGFIQISNVSVCTVNIKSTEGSVEVAKVKASQVQIATDSGKITASQLVLPLRSVVQTETNTGSIKLTLAQFAGIVNVVTGGQITCSGDGFSAPCAVTSQHGVNHVELATANCEDEGDCYYTGAVSVTSISGDVEIDIAGWDRSQAPGIPVSCVA